jgi:mycothiol synthase
MTLHATGPIQIDRCDPAAEREVLALAAQAWPEAERAAYWQSIAALVRTGQADHVVLLAARVGEQLLAVQLAQSLPGRAAAVWPPQFAAADAETCHRAAALLFARIATELASTGSQMAQALLSLNDEPAAREFTAGGFTHAADLLYMTAELGSPPESREPLPFEAVPFETLPFETVPFDAGDERRLAQLIDRTYSGSLDCPKIDGLRKTADVVAGYQAVGQFRPELWQIARHNGDDIGCLLVNLHPDVKHAEIVYVALVPEVRGRGWGLALTRLAKWLAREADCQRVVLAVDAANEPAIRLYSVAGFEVFDRKAVWIRQLSPAPNSL